MHERQPRHLEDPVTPASNAGGRHLSPGIPQCNPAAASMLTATQHRIAVVLHNAAIAIGAGRGRCYNGRIRGENRRQITPVFLLEVGRQKTMTGRQSCDHVQCPMRSASPVQRTISTKCRRARFFEDRPPRGSRALHKTVLPKDEWPRRAIIELSIDEDTATAAG